MKTKLLVFGCLLFILNSAMSQFMRYEDKQNSFFGINTGTTWHTGDVQNVDHAFRGLGFIMGTSLNHEYGRALSFDLRVRYLGGIWLGMDNEATNNFAENTTLSSLFDPDNDVVIQNFRAGQHMINFELAVHANRFRENTRLDPYIFGGFGHVWTRTTGDFTDSDGFPYDFNNNPNNDIFNGSYSTPLDMNSSGDPYPTEGSWAMNWMPSLGVGLGFYFSNRFSIGVEHKTTFFPTNYFDGTTVNQQGIASTTNDMFHYTSAYLRWYLKQPEPKPVRPKPTPPPHQQTDPGAYTRPHGNRTPPNVYFTSPSEAQVSTNQPTYVLQAMLQNVPNNQNVLFRQDGTQNHNYTYNQNTGRFQSTVNLKPGQNIFKIRGTNNFGSDEATVVVVYEREVANPPIVKIVEPAYNPYTVNQSFYGVKANIQNIENKSQINVSINGSSVGTNFDFTPFGVQNFFRNMSLNPGLNTISITVTNKYGSATDEIAIIYQREADDIQIDPPVVYFTSPAMSGIRANDAQIQLKGNVYNVDGRENITFTQNGEVDNNFNYSNTSKELSAYVVLKPGANVFQIAASNSAGTDYQSILVNYDVPSPQPPIISFINPISSPHVTSTSPRTVAATILNVNTSNQITVTFNGGTYSNFEFNPDTKILRAQLPLKEGSNEVRITASNSDGSDVKSTTLIYQPVEELAPPLVEFIDPSHSPSETFQPNVNVAAAVYNVDKKADVLVYVNGQAFNNFEYSAVDQAIKFNTNLTNGANTITVTAINTVGSNTKSTTIIKREKNVVLPPVVSFIQPDQNPKEVYSSNLNVIARVQNVEDKSDIKVEINGNTTTAFDYIITDQLIRFSSGLQEGANIITITAENEAGKDIESTTVIYRKPKPLNPPVVNITNPVQSVYTTNFGNKTVTATVHNVDGVNDIEVVLNGSPIYNFEYNLETKVLTLPLVLKEGENDLLIGAANNNGQAADDRVLVYKKLVTLPEPYVSFVRPVTPGQEVVHPTFEMIAKVENIEDKQGVNLRYNGQLINPSLYQYDPVTKEVRYFASLTMGNNLFQVRGTNTSGTHQAQTTVTLKEPEPKCETPEVTFIMPSRNNFSVEEPSILLKAMVYNVNSSDDITLLLNGVPVGNFAYNSTTKELSRKLNLMEGNNVVEIIAQTDCGQVDVNRTVRYVPPLQSCDEPIIQFISNINQGDITQNEQVTVNATISHVDQLQQIQLLVNGQSTNFSFDLGTHTFTATIPLNIGDNLVAIIANNDCGIAEERWRITREACQNPVINVVPQPEPNADGVVSTNQLTLSGTISYAKQGNIQLLRNGEARSFNFNEQLQQFGAAINLVENQKTILEVKVDNGCATANKLIEVTYKAPQKVNEPTVVFTNPSESQTTTETGTMLVTVKTTNINSANQLSVQVNGASRQFNFDASSNTISFQQNWKKGNNTVNITAANGAGVANAQVGVNYEEPVVVQPPAVTIANPAEDIITSEDMIYDVNGTITNLDNLNQVQIKVNNEVVNNVNFNFVDGLLNFAFNVNVTSAIRNYEIVVQAANSAGVDVQQRIITRRSSGGSNVDSDDMSENPDNCVPNITINYSNEDKLVEITSNLPLDGVAMKFHDNTVQATGDLAGNTVQLRGTGINTGKCIIGVWVQSGCNYEGNDDPGQFYQNDTYAGICTDSPCDKPTVTLLSNQQSLTPNYNFQIGVQNVQANEVGVTHNGSTLNCSYIQQSNTMNCQVNLVKGVNTFVVTADGCETVTETFEVNYNVPCQNLTYDLVYPARLSSIVDNQNIDVSLRVRNIEEDGINASLNGKAVPFTLSGTTLSISSLTLQTGSNTLALNLSNDCSNKTVTYNITYEPLTSCGPRINPGNADWQFCLVTPSGTFTRSDLANPNFTYQGPAYNLYFLPIAGGGNATVSGEQFPINAGNYYLFEGNLRVNLSRNPPGNKGQWQICITSDAAPTFGNGARRPPSPCQSNITNPIDARPSGTTIGRPSGTTTGSPTGTSTPRPSGTTSNRPSTSVNKTNQGNVSRPGGTVVRPNRPSRPKTTSPSRERVRGNTGNTNIRQNARGINRNQNNNEENNPSSGGIRERNSGTNVARPRGRN